MLPEMPLEKIVRDPENPRPPLHLRTPEEQTKQAELNSNVRQRGVKSPISLRPHPTLPDMWVINHGHCRYDAAEAAGLATIPYFVDPNFDSYDQVAENLHRCDLSIWAIAAFIKRKLDEGHSKSHIAERMGKEGQNYVTEHLALVDAPACVHQAYANAVRSTRTLYDLRRAYDEFPEQVEEWCNSGARVTRDAIKELSDRLRHDVIGVSTSSGEVSSQHHSSPQSPSDVKPTDQDCQPAVPSAADESLRHDVTLARQAKEQPLTSRLRHDVMSPKAARASSTSRQMPRASFPPTEILVTYRGRTAKLAPDTKVEIIVEGDVAPLYVALAELVFESTEARDRQPTDAGSTKEVKYE